MDSHTLRVLEFDKVLDLVAKHTHWSLGTELVKKLVPLDDYDDLLYRQAELKEACDIYNQSKSIGVGGLHDCRDSIKGAELGRLLLPEEILQIGLLAAASRKTGKYLRDCRGLYPKLSDRALGLSVFNSLEQQIEKCISQEGKVLDSATPRLREIRSEISILQGRVQGHLNGVLRSTTYAKMLQEPLVTVRSGRFVVPIKSEYRSHFPGLVIDQSATGATLYMEPSALVELSNKVRVLILAEEREVNTVLARISGIIGQNSPALLRSVEELAWLDALMALAAYSAKAKAVLPEISQGETFRLVEVRHPLLVHRLGDKVVPSSLELKDGIKTVIVTGPNTGGKTVSLKTVGLITAMALSGMPVPAKAGTQVPFLEQLWADIGDEQSIAQNLSTFSAHMNQVMKIIPNAGPKTLVLLDELGAGTDPSEGGALGMALIEYFHGKGCFTVVTTHLSELKVFASRTAGITNAAVEFDTATLAPTYRILMGVPGRSNALRIAERLGLPGNIARKAKEHLGEHHVDIEGLLDQLDQERKSAENMGDRLSKEHTVLKKTRAQYEAKLSEIEVERFMILETARDEAKGFLDNARQEVHRLLRSVRDHLNSLDKARRQSIKEAKDAAQELTKALMNSGNLEVFAELSPISSEVLAKAIKFAAGRIEPKQSSQDETEDVSLDRDTDINGNEDLTDILEKEDLEEFILPTVSESPSFNNLDIQDSADQSARESVRMVEAELQELLRQADDMVPDEPVVVKNEDAAQKKDLPLEVGSHVYLRTYGQDAVVTAINGKKLEVLRGVIRLTVNRRDVEVIEKPNQVLQGAMPESRRATISERVDLHGMTVDEALLELGYRIDEAFMSNMTKLEIIHGKGSGILRRAITEYVKEHPMVASHRLGEVYEGGLGVTVIYFK